MYWGLAFRNIFRNGTRSAVTLSAIAIGCVSIIIAGGFIQQAIEDVRESTIRAYLGHIQIYRKGFWENGLIKPFDYLILAPEEVMKAASSLPGVEGVMPRIEFPGLLSTGETTMPCVAQGIDAGREAEYKKNSGSSLTLLSGRNLSAEDGDAVLLGAGVAKALHAKEGDSLALLTTTRSGSLNGVDLIVKGVFRMGSKDFDDRVIRLPIKTAQSMLRLREVQKLMVFLDHTEHTDEALARLQGLLAGRDLEAKPWYRMEDADYVLKLVGFYKRLFLVLKLIIILVVVLSVFNTMNMSVLERIGEIGTTMALGVKTRGVMVLFLTEGLILGCLGGGLGLVLGYVLAHVVSYVGIPMGVPPGWTAEWIARIKIVPDIFAFAFAQAVAVSVFSSLYPAFKAARLEIAEALRHNV